MRKNGYKEREDDREFGIRYDVNSASLVKFRNVANRAGGVMDLDRLHRVQYAEAVEQAVLSSQRAQLGNIKAVVFQANCASGTFHNDGDSIGKAIAGKHRASLAACPSQVRRARTPAQWLEMYGEAMAEKHQRNKIKTRKEVK